MEDITLFITGAVALLLLTSFVRILTTLCILRFGLGLDGWGFGIAMVGLALGLTWFVISPQFEQGRGIRSILQAVQDGDQKQWQTTFKPFLMKHAAVDVRERFARIAVKLAHPKEESLQIEGPLVESDAVLIAAFLVSELRNAFQIGLLLIIPFFILDLIVTNILMCLGITQLPYQVISLPLKFALFCIIDGWALLADKLVSAYI